MKIFLSSSNRKVILSLIVIPILFLAFYFLNSPKYYSSSDEGYYYQYALWIEKHGLKGFHQLLSWYSSSNDARLHPSPMRVGYISIMAFLFKIFGPSFNILGLCSLLSLIFFLWICFYFARRYFDLDTALVFVLLLSYSPLMLGLSMRALVDGPINFLWGFMAWMFYDFLMSPSTKKRIIIILLLSFSILIKESSIIFLSFLGLVSFLFKKDTPKVSIGNVLLIPVWVVVIDFLIYDSILGGRGIMTMIGAVLKVHSVSAQHSPYAIDYCSGPWFRYLLDFFLLNPVMLLLAFAYMGFLIARRDLLDFRLKYFIFYFMTVYFAFNLLPHSKIVRAVENLEMVLDLLGALMMLEIFKPQENDKKQKVFIWVLTGLVLINWYGFLHLFFRSGLLDPVTYNLLLEWQFIPNLGLV